MWRVTYDRHHMYRFFKTTTCEVPTYWVALACYWYWIICYTMTELPVKQVSIYRYENGVLYLKGGRSRAEHRVQLNRLKTERFHGYKKAPL